MSAKGLPPAVRLDPLLPQSFSVSSPSLHPLYHNHHHHPLYPSYECAKQARPPLSSIPVSSLCLEAPRSVSGCTKTRTPPISSPNDHGGGGRRYIAKPRGLTPIIITPSSSRAHTPVSSQLLPLPPSLCRPRSTSSESSNTTNCIGTANSKPKKIKIEPRVEPVDLEPLLPTKREPTPKVMAVFDDEAECESEKEREGRSICGEGHVRQDRDDGQLNTVNRNPQLPTPQSTPVTQALDTPNNTVGNGEPAFQYTPSCTGKVINLPSIQLDQGIHPMSLDDSCPVDSLRERREKEVERGRKRERGPSRFTDERRHHHHLRPGPYDTKSRPLTKCSQTRTKTAHISKEIDGVAAILLAAGMDIDLRKSRSHGERATCNSGSPGTSATVEPCPHLGPGGPSPPVSTMSATSPPPLPPSHQQQHRKRSVATPMSTPQQSQPAPAAEKAALPSRAIQTSADEMIHLFTRELEVQLSAERENLRHHLVLERQQMMVELQREHQCLEEVKTAVQREREELKTSRLDLEREREELKAEVEKEMRDIKAVREENEILRVKVEELEKARGLGSGVNGPGRRS